jgi:hypothetical protein
MTQKPPWVLIATLIAGGGLSAIGQAFATALPANSALIANIVAIVVAGAGLVVTYYQAVNAPATALVGHTDGNIPVVNPASGQTIGTVVTTSSTIPTTAPSQPKGP